MKKTEQKEFDFNMFTVEALTVMPIDIFGGIIHLIRIRNDISRQQFAENLGISSRILQMLEDGDIPWSDIRKIFDKAREHRLEFKAI